MRVVRWARLQSAAPCGLRLGAWYPVTGLTAREAQVQVRGRVLMVPRSLLELRTTPPLEWTVAPGGTDGARGLAGAAMKSSASLGTNGICAPGRGATGANRPSPHLRPCSARTIA